MRRAGQAGLASLSRLDPGSLQLHRRRTGGSSSCSSASQHTPPSGSITSAYSSLARMYLVTWLLSTKRDDGQCILTKWKVPR